MYTLKLHKNLTLKKWCNYSKGQQILMIANELNRAQNWLQKEENFEVNQCYERAFELLDLTLEDKKWHKGIKEILRFREMLAELYVTKEKDKISNKKAYDILITLTPESYNMLH